MEDKQSIYFDTNNSVRNWVFIGFETNFVIYMCINMLVQLSKKKECYYY